MRLTEDQQRALVAQREREAVAVELAGLRRDAERARWCEQNEADVDFLDVEKVWAVVWIQQIKPYEVHDVEATTRNAAIDKAMGENPHA